jgi:hypothetical protein
MIERGEIDTVWPFFRDGASPGSVTEGLSQVDGIIAGSGTHPPRNPVEFIGNLTPKLARDNPEKIFLYGDNLEGWGKSGQAVIRDEPNALGIPTKKYPGMKDEHFFRDTEYAANVRLIDAAFDQIPEGATVVVPKAGLGTGRARLNQTAPRTYEYLQMRVSEMQGIPSATPIIGKGGVQTHGTPPGASRAAGEPGGSIPRWLQQTRAVAGEGSVPISWEARVGNPSAVARHVKARVYEPSNQAPQTMWTWDTTMQRPVTPRDMGGFDINGGPLGEHIGVSPYSLPEEMLEEAAHSSTIKKNVLWQDKQGDMMWLREGQEETIPWFNPGDTPNTAMSTRPTVVKGSEGKNMVLSNWGEHPMTFRGKRFDTAEGAYHAHKSGEYYAGFETLNGSEALFAARTGGAAGPGAEPGTYQGVQKIISGGQTGADQAGWFAAEELGIVTGGHMPKGYKVEGGTDAALGARFKATEHESADWVPRNYQNNLDADGTVWFGSEGPGKGATRREARNAGTPWLENPSKARFLEWLEENNVQVLNVAGNRASKNPELFETVKAFLTDALSETPVVSAGKKIPTLTTKIAGEDANVTLMREILDAKYDQIPAFRTALLNSGVITHPVGGFWEEAFPRLLTDLRTKKAAAQGEWTAMGEQWLGPYDILNQIEHSAATGVDELNNLVTNFSRIGKSTMAQKGEIHHQINMELADSVDGIVSSGRVTRWGNPTLLPPL